MAIPQYYFADLVRETCVATGSGALALSGAVPGHRTFAGTVPAATPLCYAIAGVSNPGEWESGIGEIDSQGCLVRSVVSASSNGGMLVPFSAGLKTVALTVGARWFTAVGDPPDIGSIAGLGTALAAKQPVGSYADTAHLHLVTVAGGAAGFMSGTDKAKLDTVAANATVNASDAALRDRASHTGTQSAATISGLGTLATQAALAVNITGGAITGVTINNAVIGAATRAAVNCTVLDANAAVTLAAGTAALPSLSRTGDTNTGLFYPAADTIALSTNGGERLRVSAVGLVTPGADNVQTLGSATARWSTLFAGTGTINTSDARDKVWRGGLSVAERAAARAIIAELGFFQWSDAVAAKGADPDAGGARLHCGPRAQAVWAIMAAHGLVDPIGGSAQNADGGQGRPGRTPYAFLCFNAWDEPDGPDGARCDRYGLRLDQLALFLIAGLAPVRRRRRTQL